MSRKIEITINDDISPTALIRHLQSKMTIIHDLIETYDDVATAGYLQQIVAAVEPNVLWNESAFYIMSRLLFALKSCDDDNVDARHEIMWLIIDLTELTTSIYDID